MKPVANLISWTHDPLLTLYKIWQASKSNEPYEVPHSFKLLEDTFISLYNQEVPVIENVVMTFILENVSISFREQMVRHRVGVKIGDRLGADIVPDLAESSWWSQSMRIMDMGKFADERRFRVADSIAAIPEAQEVFQDCMKFIEDTYNVLLEMGIPIEDARDVVPLGATHRISWTLNLRTMKHIVGLRSCWMAQSSLWHDVIHSMIEGCKNQIHPIFQIMAFPPCVDKRTDTFKACVLAHENERRISGDDPVPVCPLWLYRERWGGKAETTEGLPLIPEMQDRAKEFARFWGHDPYTWDPIRGSWAPGCEEQAKLPLEAKEAPEG